MENNNCWYVPLAAQFRTIDGAMPLSRFAAIEAVLHLLSTCDPTADPMKAYLLFAHYQLISTQVCTPLEHILQQARLSLGHYRSQKYWQDDLRKYRDDRYNAVRAFSFSESDGTTSFSKAENSYPYPYEKRELEWNRYWEAQDTSPRARDYATNGSYTYLYQDSITGEADPVSVKFDNITPCIANLTTTTKWCRAPISISLDDLLNAAKEMAEIRPNDPCHTILSTNLLKQVSGSDVVPCEELTIHKVVNIVGMVGSGKSTLIKVLAFWCHKNRYRISIVLDTVAEVLNLQKYLSSFGVAASPLIGRGERLKYINQVAQPDETCLDESFSQYLTPTCLVDGMDDHHSKSIAFGKEPCYFFKQSSKRFMCPFFNQCPATRMLRECYSSTVVLTTVAGFAATRVGHTRETFFELAMREFDAVIFDESDRVQKTLDILFMPETKFNEYIQESADDCHEFMSRRSIQREADPALQKYAEMQLNSMTVLSCIVKSLRHELGSWNRITYRDHFSAFTLLEDLYEQKTEYQIPQSVYQAIYDLIDMQNEDINKLMDKHDEESSRTKLLWATLQSSCKSIDESFFEQMYEQWLTALGSSFPRPGDEKTKDIQDSRIKLILRLIYFDHFIRDLSDAYEASHETAFGQNELFGFLQTRFRQQQQFLPSSLCGNLFGLKKTDDEDIVLFRQFAFGRSLMKDLPYLRTDIDGNPAGPHVILFSGSSWAEGSYEYHVNRPVNYILEADKEKRAFLEKTRFFESGFTERVSGAADDQRMFRLRAVTQKAVDLIIREYERKAGKILLVVNSFVQAEEIHQTLIAALRKENCPAGVCRMISDEINNSDQHGTIRRGEVGRFAKMKEDILIAPAMSIERGHNIVDERGHSALCAVFFMVRPMAYPDDLQQNGSKLNGYVESNCKRDTQESLYAYNARIRRFATQRWARMNRTKSYGLATLSADERKDVVATLFVLILQIFGRLARVTDTTKPEPHVYFIDGAFRGHEDKENDFDCLSELGKYLETLMTQTETKQIAETLYAPFYRAYRKDIPYGK